MIEGQTIVCFASGYDAPPTSKHHVMRLLAERNTVLWVNYHGSRRPSAKGADVRAALGKLAQAAGGLRQRGRNLHVLTPLVVPLPGCRGARSLNRRLLARQLRSALRRIQSGPVQVWSFSHDVGYLLDDIRPERTVYYCVDAFSQFDGYDARQVACDEAELCRRADLVVTTSEALLAAKSPLNPRTILVPHGVDHAHFARACREDLAEPADLAGMGRPRLGFFGLIHEWVDVPLLAAVATARPEWQLVLIGQARADLSPIQDLPNVHLLGNRPYEQLPAYCGAFDVGLIPFVLNELTESVNPIKLREYLAAGLPVVSTGLPEVRRYEPLATIADGPDAFVAAVQRCLAEPAAKRLARSQAVADESWRRKIDTICAALNDFHPHRSQSPCAS